MTARQWKDGDLVLRVGPRDTQRPDRGNGRWTAGKPYRIVLNSQLQANVLDDRGDGWSGSDRDGCYNKFVSFDDLYEEAEAEDAERHSWNYRQHIASVTGSDTIRDTLETNTPTPDPVFQPPHYAGYTIEPITFINANNLNFNRGNVVKYTARAGKKGDDDKEIEDLEKARRYLDIEIECIRRRRRVADGDTAADVWKKTL